MKIDEIEKLIKRLEIEIKQTQEKKEQAESLVRLKEIYKTYQGEDKLISSKDILEEIKNEKEEFKILTGWTQFDKIIKGFRLGQLITVSGITKHGKTAWCVDLTSKLKEHKPLWFPLEEGGEEIVRKFIEREEEPPLFYLPKSNKLYNLEWLETKIIEAIAKYDTKIVFIDQLDFVVQMQGESHALRVAQTMRDLKQMANKWNVIIVLMCHLVKTRLDNNPDLNDLRGSGAIAQESDTVIIIWRETKRINGQIEILNNVNISIQANRRFGKTGNIKMVFNEGHFLEQSFVSIRQEEYIACEEYENFN